jgi:Tfp pilus assembly protein PilE
MSSGLSVPRRRRGESGFTVLELGIAVGVMAVLMIGVIGSRGYVLASRIGATVQMVDTLRKTSRAYAERHNSSASFSGVSLASLEADGFIEPGLVTPFETAVSVGPDVTAEHIIIQFAAPDAPTRDSCVSALDDSGTVSTAGLNISVVTR